MSRKTQLLTSALLALVCTTACSGSTSYPDDLTSDPKLEATVIAQLSDSIALLTLNPQTALNALPKARDYLGNTLLKEVGLLAFANRTPEQPLPATINGLDVSRPIVVGLRTPPDAEIYANAVYGVLPDLEDAPNFLRVTATFPANDPRALHQAFTKLLRKNGAREARLAAADRDAVKGYAAVMDWEENILLFEREANDLIVEMLVPLRETVPPGSIGAAMAPPSPEARTRTPGLSHFLHNSGIAGAYLDLSKWPLLLIYAGAAAGAEAMEEAGPDKRVALTSEVLSNLLTTAVRLTPSERLVHDVGIRLDVDEDVTLTLAETLTSRGARAYETARKERVPVHPVEASDPVATLHIGYSMRRLEESLGSPAPWLSPAMALGDDFYGLGVFAWSGPGWLRLDTWLSERLTDSTTVVFDGLAFPPGGGEPGLKVGVLASSRAPIVPQALEQLKQHALGTVNDARIREEGAYNLLEFSTGPSLENLIEVDDPETIDDNIRATIDLGRFDQIPWPEQFPESLDRWLRPFESAHFVSTSRGNALGSILRLIPKDGGSGDDTLAFAIPGEPAPPVNNTPGFTCMERAAQILQQGFAKMAPLEPEPSMGVIADLDKALVNPIGCTSKDRHTGQLLRRFAPAWRLLKARVAETAGDDDTAMEEAQLACKGGMVGACRLSEKLTPPWEVETLNLPFVPWQRTPALHKAGHAINIGLSQEGVYLEKKRLGDRMETPRLKLDDIVKLGAANAPFQPVIVQIKADGNILMQDIRHPIAAAEGANVPTRIIFKDSDGRNIGFDRLPANFKPSSGTTVWVDVLADRVSMAWYNTRGKLQTKDLLRAKHPFMDVSLARASAAIKKEAPSPITFRLYGAPQLPWGQMAPMISSLRLPGNVPTDGDLKTMVRASKASNASITSNVVLLIHPESPSR